MEKKIYKNDHGTPLNVDLIGPKEERKTRRAVGPAAALMSFWILAALMFKVLWST